MKRMPMVRRTPLRSAAKLVTRIPLRSRTQIAPVSAKKLKERGPRMAAEAALGRDRTQGSCACCGLFGYVNGHERLGRGQLGDATKPDCLACPLCNSLFEDEPIWAAWHGWKHSRKHPRDPELAPNQGRRLDGSIHTFGDVE